MSDNLDIITTKHASLDSIVELAGCLVCTEYSCEVLHTESLPTPCLYQRYLVEVGKLTINSTI